MLTLREKLQIAGLSLLMTGMLCLPMPLASPKLALSLFSTLNASAWFVGLGSVTVLAGLVVLMISAWVKR